MKRFFLVFVLLILFFIPDSNNALPQSECTVRCWNLGEVADSGNYLYALWHQCPWGHFTTSALIPLSNYY